MMRIGSMLFRCWLQGLARAGGLDPNLPDLLPAKLHTLPET